MKAAIIRYFSRGGCTEAGGTHRRLRSRAAQVSCPLEGPGAKRQVGGRSQALSSSIMIFERSLQRELAYTAGAVFMVLLTLVLTTMMIRIVGFAASGRDRPARRAGPDRPDRDRLSGDHARRDPVRVDPVRPDALVQRLRDGRVAGLGRQSDAASSSRSAFLPRRSSFSSCSSCSSAGRGRTSRAS